MIIVPSILYLGTVGTSSHLFHSDLCLLADVPMARTYALATALGIMTCYYSGRPGGDFFVGLAPRIALTYSAVGIALNVLCSSLICWYILRELAGGSSRNRGARNALNIVVEAMLPYTLFGVAYVTLLGLDSPIAILFLSLYVMFTVRASLSLSLPLGRMRVFCEGEVTVVVR